MPIKVDHSCLSSPPSSSKYLDFTKFQVFASRRRSGKKVYETFGTFRSLYADTTYRRRFLDQSKSHQTVSSLRKGYANITHVQSFSEPIKPHKALRSFKRVNGGIADIRSLSERRKNNANCDKFPNRRSHDEENDLVTKVYSLSASIDDMTFGLGSHIMKRNIDVTTFGNLCVDIVLKVHVLPPSSTGEKLAYMEELAASSPDTKFWEAGGNSNFAIAAARLGLHCAALGHVSHEKYGSFLREVLEEEGVQVIRYEEDNSREETLVCWVLVDHDHCHDFLSRFDFNKEPAFKCIKELPMSAKHVINQSKVLFCNGFLFDELSPEVIMSAADFANESGCIVFFDPGPRGKSLFKGLHDQRLALDKLLNLSDVLLLTADEAESLTGIADPVFSAKALLEKGENTKWVIVKMGEKGCLMITTQGIYQVPAFKVDIKDTVGCGDSFAAAVALGYTRGLPVTSTLALANAVGAATAMGCGAGRNVATLNDVIEILLSSTVYDESNGNGTVHKFSMEEAVTIGLTEMAQRDSTCSHSSWSKPFDTVTRETVNFLNQSGKKL